MRSHLLAAIAAGLFAPQLNAAPRRAEPTAPVDCSAVRFPVQLSMAGALDGFAGEYSGGGLTLSLRQVGYRVLLTYNGAERELREVARWRFEDGCGATYQFSLPMNGTGASLELSGGQWEHQRLRRSQRGEG